MPGANNSGATAPAPAPTPSSGASTNGATGISGLTGDVTTRNRRRGYQGRNHDGRRSGNSGRGSGSYTGSNNSRTPTASTFKGREDAIKGHVYDTVNPSASAAAFITTTEEIAEYAGRTLKMGNHVKRSMERMKEVPVAPPVKPKPPAGETKIDELDMEVYRQEVKAYVMNKELLQASMMRIYSVIYGQCSDGVRAKVEAMNNHQSIVDDGDAIGLLKNIKSVMANFQTSRKPVQSIMECKRTLLAYRQGRDQTVPEYYKLFKGLIDVIEYNSGSIGAEQGLYENHLRKAGVTVDDKVTEAQRSDALSLARDETIAYLFLFGADKNRFGKLLEDIENAFTQKDDRFPTDLTEAYKLLTNWKQYVPPRRGNGAGNEVSLTNIGNEEDMSFANLGGDNTRVQCYNCQQMGHYANDCTNDRVARTTRAGTGDNNTPQGNEVQLLTNAFIEDDGSDYSDFSFHIGTECRGGLSRTWVLLDNQSTVNIFCNGDLLTNIRTVDEHVTVNCNAGVTTTNQIGDLKGVGPVWYNPDGIANILSLSRVEEQYPVSYSREGGFVIHKGDGTIRRFIKSDRGLFYLDVAKNRKRENESDDTILINTVANNQSKYTVKEYRMAELARKVQCMIGRPSTKDYLDIVDNNQLRNCPVDRNNVSAAENILGPDVGSLKGKTVRESSDQVVHLRTNIPPQLYERYKDVSLSIDIMFINKVAFFMTRSKSLRFGSSEHIVSRNHETLLTCIKKLRSVYRLGGFRITHIDSDKEFEPMRDKFAEMKIHLNAASDDEHVGDIERFIRTVKERVRATWNTLPFRKIPSRMLIEFVKGSVFWLNAFPLKGGVSTTHSPRTIVTLQQIDYNQHCKLEPGAYVQTHEEHDNTMKTRTVGAIALRTKGNSQGGYYFLSLKTGHRIDRRRWTELPMPSEVIDRVHALARRNKAGNGLTFGWRDGSPILDDDTDEDMADPDYNPDHYDSESDSDDDDDEDNTDPAAGVEHNNNNILNEETINEETDSDSESVAEAEEEDEPDVAHPNEDDNQAPHVSDDDNDEDSNEYGDESTVNESVNDESVNESTEDEQQTTDDADESPTINNNITVETVENDIAEAAGGAEAGVEAHTTNSVEEGVNETRRSGLRPRKAPNYSRHMHGPSTSKKTGYTLAHIQHLEHIAMAQYAASEGVRNLLKLEHTALTQYSVKKGLKVFGNEGTQAVLDEMKQLDNMDVIEPMEARTMTRTDKRSALEYLMFLKKKRCGRIKGRGCADGRKQRGHMTKEETSSPTVSTEGLLLSCTIDAQEGRDVATTDIPGAFMQTDINDTVYVRLSGPLATLLAKVDKDKYEKFVVEEGGKPVIYVRLKKALYGTLNASLLFWKDLTAELKGWGFVVNPYDECVANKMVNGKQCTVLWHVDDLKISHVDSKVVDDVLDKLGQRYGKDAPLVTTRGKIHEYLGMTLDFTNDGEVMIKMYDYEDEIVDGAPTDMEGNATSPAADHLYEVNNNTPVLLGEDRAKHFHTTTAKLLFLTKRARPDLHQGVGFLTTRVRAPDEDDWKKLGRVIRYLRANKHLPLTLRADDARIMKWWIDASFAVHPDMKSHTGGNGSLGKGSFYTASTRQKLNTKSSTEAELVGVDDLMPMILWSRYFLLAQGYKMGASKVYQDNQSTMLLAKNGRASSGKRTRHINIRFFLVKDRVKSGEIEIEYCPTDMMIADYLTKPLQGLKFRWFRDQVLNIQSK